MVAAETMTSHSRIRLFLLIVLLFTGCRDSGSGVQYRSEILRVESVYLIGSRDLAKRELLAHLQYLQENTVGIDREGMDVNWLLGMAWVQLASVYEMEGDAGNELAALSRAAECFLKSRHPLFLQDVKHNRRETDERLRSFLRTVEGASVDSTPGWKR